MGLFVDGTPDSTHRFVLRASVSVSAIRPAGVRSLMVLELKESEMRLLFLGCLARNPISSSERSYAEESFCF